MSKTSNAFTEHIKEEEGGRNIGGTRAETAAVAFGVTDLGAGRGACVLGPTCIGSQYILQVFIPRLQLCTTQRRHAGGVHPLRSHLNQSAATHRHDDSTHSYTQHTRPGPKN